MHKLLKTKPEDDLLLALLLVQAHPSFPISPLDRYLLFIKLKQLQN